jgi:tripartite-type tricarboxylate transporter receptor subunit TctC
MKFVNAVRSAVGMLVLPWLCADMLCAAENYPSKPGRLILPFGAGASTDIVGRLFAQRFSEAWGQTLIVDNRPGAGGQTRAVNRDPLAGCERP